MSPAQAGPSGATSGKPLAVKASCDPTHQCGPGRHADPLELAQHAGTRRGIEEVESGFSSTQTWQEGWERDLTTHAVGTEVELRLWGRGERASR